MRKRLKKRSRQWSSRPDHQQFFTRRLLCFAIFWRVWINVRTDELTRRVKIMITTSWDCGSAEWINNSGVVNDPLSQPTVWPASGWTNVCERTDGKTDYMCEYCDHYFPGLWIGLADQKCFESIADKNGDQRQRKLWKLLEDISSKKKLGLTNSFQELQILAFT